MGASVYSLIALALAGWVHCAGMCGPFVLALGWRREGAAHPTARMALYVLGKCAAYVLLALTVAVGAGAMSRELVGEREHALHAARGALAWFAGAVMIVAGLAALGLVDGARSWLGRALSRPFAALMRASRTLPPLGAALALGLINGLLPCGLSWSAILLSATQEGVALVVGPIVFGLATAPALVTVAAGGQFVSARWRARAQRVAALGMVLFGAWTAWRGGLPLGPQGAERVPPCCSEVDAREH